WLGFHITLEGESPVIAASDGTLDGHRDFGVRQMVAEQKSQSITAGQRVRVRLLVGGNQDVLLVTKDPKEPMHFRPMPRASFDRFSTPYSRFDTGFDECRHFEILTSEGVVLSPPYFSCIVLCSSRHNGPTSRSDILFHPPRSRYDPTISV